MYLVDMGGLYYPVESEDMASFIDFRILVHDVNRTTR